MLRPLNDRIIIELVEKEERTASGIFLPDTAAKEKPQTGEVIAVGPGKLNEKGERVAVDVKVGDKVRIISGPFAEFIGDITEVYPDKSKLRAMVSIFGRETPVELEYKQIQKL